MKVKQITFNWFQRGSTSDRDGAGEDYDFYEVGRKGVVEIIENEPHNGFQKWNYVIKCEDGSTYRVFNPNWIEYFKTK